MTSKTNGGLTTGDTEVIYRSSDLGIYQRHSVVKKSVSEKWQTAESLFLVYIFKYAVSCQYEKIFFLNICLFPEDYKLIA